MIFSCIQKPCATSDYVYVLFNGCKSGAYRMPDEFYVFNWEGEPVKKYELDKNICAIAVDEKRNLMIGAVLTEEESCLVCFVM